MSKTFKANLQTDPEWWYKPGAAIGDFCWITHGPTAQLYIMMLLPGRTEVRFNGDSENVAPNGAELVTLPVTVQDNLHLSSAWKWDGDRIAPTLHPSILNKGSVYNRATRRFEAQENWHGHLIAGVFRTCGE